MAIKPNWIPFNDDTSSKVRSLCPPGTYRTIGQDDLIGIVPDGLRAKVSQAVVMTSGSYSSSDGPSYFVVVNMIRHDEPEIDQHPLVVGFVNEDQHAPSGCLIDHGDWDGRTHPEPSGFWAGVEASGLNNVFPLADFPANRCGPLADLDASHHRAFERSIQEAFYIDL